MDLQAFKVQNEEGGDIVSRCELLCVEHVLDSEGRSGFLDFRFVDFGFSDFPIFTFFDVSILSFVC